MQLKDFRDKFNSLTPLEQNLLKILAIANEPIGEAKLVAIVNSIGIGAEPGYLFDPKQFKVYKARLEKFGWTDANFENQIEVKEEYVEAIMRKAVIQEHFDGWVREIQTILPYREWYKPRNHKVCFREMRIALYQGNVGRFKDVMEEASVYFWKLFDPTDFFNSFFKPFKPSWLQTFPLEVQTMALNFLMLGAAYELEPVEEYMSFIRNHKLLNNKEQGAEFRSQLITVLIYQGKMNEVEQLLEEESYILNKHKRTGWFSIIKGNYAIGKKYLDESLKLHQKQFSNKSAYFLDVVGPFHVLAILQQREKNYIERIHKYTSNIQQSAFKTIFDFLQATACYQENRIEAMKILMDEEPEDVVEYLFWGMASFWNQRPIHEPQLKVLQAYQLKAKKNGYDWIASELARVLSKFVGSAHFAENYANEAEALETKGGYKSMIGVVPIQEKWERALSALGQLKTKGKRNGLKTEKQSRLVWLIDFEKVQIQPKEQTVTKSGSWSKGRNVALKRIKEGGLECMTQQDMAVSKAIQLFTGYGYYGNKDYEIDFDKAIQILVGHPLIFRMDAQSVSVEIIEKQPELIVEEKEGSYEMQFSTDFEEAGTNIIKETPTRYIVLEVSPIHAEINRLLEGGRLTVPEKAKDKLVNTIGNLSNVVTIQSAVGDQAIDIPSVEAIATTHVHLLPIGDGFKLEFFVKPFHSDPPYFKPGHGREVVITEIHGERMQTRRDLKKELEFAIKVEDACPSLQKVSSYNREWHFDQVVDCLNVLVELEPLREKEQIILEHPKGEKLKIAGQADFGSLSLGIKKERDWFGLSGKIKVDEQKVMDFRQLLELVGESSTRYIEISKGNFLALTENFRRKLMELNTLLTKTKNEMRFHPLAAPVLDDFSEMLGEFEVDAAWKGHLRRLKEAKDLETKVPATFQADLRDYQEEGFQWLSQLAYWGVGACLADDMGLGKTIQALAVLVDRGKDGSALVIAPASVTRNWLREAERFAPSLNPLLFGGGNRQEMVNNLKSGDLLICSYGLMQQENELLSGQNFNTIILDEAQAIKNRSTKRSKAAMSLQGNFKIITTGTPIENHLGELWNLFNFLNPGLLGSIQKFSENYATPIERFQDKEKRTQLRHLIQPFILRRKKNDVLHELPEKTEITLTVELSPEERSFYEALRRKALDNIENIEEGGQKRFTILAELMRLRQACCNPKLVLATSPISSSKMSLFGDVVDELLANGHKALIFSQFVKHLRLIENWVKKEGINYQYLDGQTPLPKREKAINAFQEGDGDLFLISLKAGGTGLNLTAADYVIHLDPWWNPAVEDQASDRAHRIGQQRPVTIYRLITEATIEEKIVKLHAEKRDLADSLLEGTEASAKMTADDLLDLIKGN